MIFVSSSRSVWRLAAKYSAAMVITSSMVQPISIFSAQARAIWGDRANGLTQRMLASPAAESLGSGIAGRERRRRRWRG
jgi:hypothetical protein